MKGKELKNLIKQSGHTLQYLSEKSGIPTRTISSLYKKDHIELHYIESLKAALPTIAESGKLEPQVGQGQSGLIIEMLQQLADDRKKIIEMLEIKNAELQNELLKYEKKKNLT